MGYSSLALLPPDITTTLTELQSLFEAKFANWNQATVGTGTWEHNGHLFISITVDNWQLRVSYSNEPHVIIESQDIARIFAKERDDKDIIASCASRFEVSSDDDANIEYFNAYVFVLEVLETIDGAILIDTIGGSFL
jgi:hypothetical protein